MQSRRLPSGFRIGTTWQAQGPFEGLQMPCMHHSLTMVSISLATYGEKGIGLLYTGFASPVSMI